MSRSLSPPWILPYLTDVAVTHGGNLLSVSPLAANKKVQLIKFLTHQLPNDDSWIWAQISDMAYSVPVRFSKAAMKMYSRDPHFGEIPVHELKTAFIIIKDFRPMLSRVPLGPANDGMSGKAHIVLEVNAFEVKGAMGGDIWGKPMSVEAHKDIKLWVDGLREGGGNGNVLKLRKEEAERADSAAQDPTLVDARPLNAQSSIRHTFLPVRPPTNHQATSGMRGPTASKPHTEVHEGHATTARPKLFKAVPLEEQVLSCLAQADFMDPNEQTGPAIDKVVAPTEPRHNLKSPATPPPKRRNALDFSSPTSPAGSIKAASSSSESSFERNQRQTTPPEWSPSQRDSQEEDMEVEQEEGEGVSAHGDQHERQMSVVDFDEESGRVSGDEREERQLKDHEERKRRTSENLMHDETASPEKTSSFPLSSLTLPPAAQRPRQSSPLSPSAPHHHPSLPSPSSPSVNNGVVLVASSSALPARSPSPANPAKRILHRYTADEDSTTEDKSKGKVLVPDSDTSGTTQSRSLSQTQKRKRDLSPSQNQSQSAWVLQSQGTLESAAETQGSLGVPAEGERVGGPEGGNEEEATSQEHPLAQSLEYSSQSQQKSQADSRPTEGVHEVVPEDGGGDGHPKRTEDTRAEVHDERKDAFDEEVIPGSDAAGEESPIRLDSSPHVKDHVRMEDEESTGDDLTDAEDEVMATLERFNSDSLAEEEGDKAKDEDEDVPHEPHDDEDEDEERRRLSSGGARNTSPRVDKDEVEHSTDVSLPSASPRKPQHRVLRTGPRIVFTPTPSPPASRTPSLPSEPDVFMDEESLSTHSELSPSADDSLANRRRARPRRIAALSSSSPESKHSAHTHSSPEAGPSAAFGTPKSTSTSESPPKKTKAPYLFHDPEAWAAPSFQRSGGKTTLSKVGRKSEARASKPAPEVAQQRSAASAAKGKGRQVESMAPAGFAEEPHAGERRPFPANDVQRKRKRVSEGSVMSTPNVRPHKKRKHSVSPSPSESPPQKRRAVAGKQAASRGSAPGSVLAKSDSLTSTVERVRKIDLRRESSSSSSHIRRSVVERQSVPRDSVASKTDLSGSTVARLPKVDLSREPSLARSSASSAGDGLKGDGNPRQLRTGRSSGSVERNRNASSASASGARSAVSPGEEPAPRKGDKLGGFKLDLDLDVRDYPGLVTWDKYAEILQRIQRARERERQREQPRE